MWEYALRREINFKLGKEEYAKDSLNTNGNLSRFYESFGDTLVEDTITYPKARIYG